LPTTTLTVANGEIQRPFGFESFATTTNLTTNDQVISTELGYRWNQADHFNGWYCIIRGSGDNDEVVRRVEDYSGEAGALTVTGAALANESGSVTCEVSRFHPEDVKRALNRARQNAFPNIGLVRDVETVVTGVLQTRYTVPSTVRRIQRVELGGRYEADGLSENLLLNGDFEDWTSPTEAANWTISGGSSEVHQEKATTGARNYGVLSGSNSARIVVPVTTVGKLEQTFDTTSSSYEAVATEGMECNVSAWVYCNTASKVTITIADTTGTAHGGTGWELIKGTVNLALGATSAQVGIDCASNAAAYPVFVDEVTMTIGPSEGIEAPYTPVYNWQHIPPAAGASNGGTLIFSENLPIQHRLRIIGVDMLSALVADSTTIEIDGELLEPLYDLTRSYLATERYSATQDTFWRDEATHYRRLYEAAILDVGLRMPARRLRVPDMV
jgi:hypothetical protein